MLLRPFISAVFAVFFASGTALAAGEGAGKYKDPFLSPAQIVEFFADTCIANRTKNFVDFRAMADDQYFRLRGSAFKAEEEAYGFRHGDVWSPTEKAGNVYLARQAHVLGCKVSGVISDPNDLQTHIVNLATERPELFKSVWDDSELSVQGVRVQPPTTGRAAARFYFSTPKSISDYVVTLETFTESLDRNFELTFDKGLEKDRIDLMHDQQEADK